MPRHPFDQNNQLGTPIKPKTGQWVQTERKAHEAWARLCLSKPRAAALVHHLVAYMGNQNAVVVSQKTLAKLMGMSERTVRYAVADLIYEKWIQVVKLNGPGTVSAYVVNDRVAWGQPRDQLRLSVFSATVVADSEDQDGSLLDRQDLRRIPALYPGEQQLPSGPGEDPPSQPCIPGMEPDLPALEEIAFMDDEGPSSEIPTRITTTNSRELFDPRPGENVAQAAARKALEG